LFAEGFPEVTVRYVLRLLYQIPVSATYEWNGEARENPGFFAHTPKTKSLKASVTRAMRSLERGDYIFYRPDLSRFPSKRYVGTKYRDCFYDKAQVEMLSEDEVLGYQWGYALRPKGVDVGLKYEPDLDLKDVLLGLSEVQQGCVAREARSILLRRAEALNVTPDYNVMPGNAYERSA
jgi:hypothetical protein